MNKRDMLKLIAILVWMSFAIVFALWWTRFGFEHTTLLRELQPERSEHWLRQQRMILWESASWIFLLVLGGFMLFRLMGNEMRRVRQIREFFASFSHEVKTSLASLRLQAEALGSSDDSPILQRLVADTVRLQVQLENSLFFASQQSLSLYFQPLELAELVERMREQWPGVQIELTQNCTVNADDRALRTILSNLIQNAIVHGQATQIRIEPKVSRNGHVTIWLTDNGRGFSGTFAKLGKLFHRPQPTSGSGLGLYICRLLMQKMRGQLLLNERNGAPGFSVGLELESAP